MKTDILIIGGGPAGIIAGLTARKNNLNKKITLIREKQKGVIPCGIPYVFHRLDSVEKNVMPYGSLDANNIHSLINKAIKINPSKKSVSLDNGEEIAYEKLILATGAKSTIAPIKGAEKNGVWHIEKDFDYLRQLREAVLASKNIVIIGGGFIGVEFAEELSSIKGLRVSVVERSDYCLSRTFDEDFALPIAEELKSKGVEIYTNTEVEEIGGNDKIEFVKIKNKKIPADLVILSIGAIPNTDLAKEAGVELGNYNGIKVNEYMETSLKDVFAVGDCSETTCLVTQKNIPIMLASTACHEARIAAANLYKRENLLKNKGTLASFSTFIGNLAIGIAGLSKETCQAEGYDLVVGEAEAPNHHPGHLPNTQKIKTKLIFERNSGKLLGGQIIGPESVGEMVNILALAIQKETTVYNFDTLQIASHPLLTSAPTTYPLISAAQSALTKM